MFKVILCINTAGCGFNKLINLKTVWATTKLIDHERVNVKFTEGENLNMAKELWSFFAQLFRGKCLVLNFDVSWLLFWGFNLDNACQSKSFWKSCSVTDQSERFLGN